MIFQKYQSQLENVEIADGFFEGWPNPPDKQTHRRILEKADIAIVAIDQDLNRIVGFINILSDGILSACIPLLEVVADYRGRGIGRKLVELALAELKDIYMVDLTCSDDMVPFYQKFNLRPGTAMMLRNYPYQAGK